MTDALSPDPNAWLYPYFSALRRTHGFARLAPVLQARALADAVQEDYPAKAVEIREWNRATLEAMLLWLDTVTANRPRYRESELWRMRKGDRELQCVAVYLPNGVDVRLLERDEMLRTRLATDALSAQGVSAEWARTLRGVGWSSESSSS